MPKKSIDKKEDDETADMILSSIQRSKENAKIAYKRMYDKMENIKKLREENEKAPERLAKIKLFKSLYPEITTDIRKHFDEWITKGEPTPNKKSKKEYKESNLMKARSDLKKSGDKYAVETEMNIKKGLDKKVKSALKKSVISELDEKISGSGVRKINLDMSDSESSSGSESDEEDIKEYSKILKHLISHITDKKEKIDKKDVKQAKELIDRIKSKKR